MSWLAKEYVADSVRVALRTPVPAVPTEVIRAKAGMAVPLVRSLHDCRTGEACNGSEAE